MKTITEGPANLFPPITVHCDCGTIFVVDNPDDVQAQQWFGHVVHTECFAVCPACGYQSRIYGVPRHVENAAVRRWRKVRPPRLVDRVRLWLMCGRAS